MRPITRIVLHHTATPDDWTRDRIWHLHTDPVPVGRGWSDIGYHRLVWSDGHDEPGRPEGTEGAHCKGYNPGSLGISLVGNFVDSNPSREQWDRAVQIVAGWCRLHGLTPADVYGHGELKPTACPGFSADSFRLSLTIEMGQFAEM